MRIVVALMMLFSIHAYAGDTADGCKKIATVASVQLLTTAARTAPRLPQSTKDDATPDTSGCCSHHSGVCGCSFGRTTCCDGTASPSCSCN